MQKILDPEAITPPPRVRPPLRSPYTTLPSVLSPHCAPAPLVHPTRSPRSRAARCGYEKEKAREFDIRKSRDTHDAIFRHVARTELPQVVRMAQTAGRASIANAISPAPCSRSEVRLGGWKLLYVYSRSAGSCFSRSRLL